MFIFLAYKEIEMCSSILVPKGSMLVALFFSIDLINDHLNPRKMFLTLNLEKGIHLDILS